MSSLNNLAVFFATSGRSFMKMTNRIHAETLFHLVKEQLKVVHHTEEKTSLKSIIWTSVELSAYILYTGVECQQVYMFCS